MECENNSAHINAFTLWAISDIIAAWPEWINTGLRWLEIFDGINLADIRKQAALARDVVPQRTAIAVVLHRELEKEFADIARPAPYCNKSERAHWNGVSKSSRYHYR